MVWKILLSSASTSPSAIIESHTLVKMYSLTSGLRLGVTRFKNSGSLTDRTCFKAASCRPLNSPITVCNWPISSVAMVPSAAIMYSSDAASAKCADPTVWSS